ncbi:MAG TPA: RNB domain-containing ribonuclease [bacterium]|nr:RNB domain-containing ribonuclease [bacterium]
MTHHPAPKISLNQLARRAMAENGLEADFPPEALEQLAAITSPAEDASLPDLTGLLWCSIDNDDSRDLDQLSVGEKLPGGSIQIKVAVADVDARVAQGTPLDLHARKNTTSVYTGVEIFPMLPEKLSTDLTSLSFNETRVALIVDMRVNAKGEVDEAKIYRARVKNKAKLAYNGVGAWLEGAGPLPEAAARVNGMEAQLRLQDEAAQRLRALRHEHGALDLQTLQPRPVTEAGVVVDLALETQNRAGQLIEDFMVAANGATARFLTAHNFPTLRRVVKTPKRWDRIVSVAADLGEKLPADPDSKALSHFLTRQRQKDPLHFPDLSLTIVKLMGRGEYALELPGQAPQGHFGLAVRDYNHSTAPNRRYPDLITQRLLKNALGGAAAPYAPPELESLARHCTQQEDAADKVERQVRKSASAAFLAPRVGDHFEALITGVSDKGTWLRLLKPPVEGKLVQGAQGLDVGDKVRVKLIGVNVEQGWIDFVRIP